MKYRSQSRNKLWKHKKKRPHEIGSDIRVLNPDGTLKEIIEVKSIKKPLPNKSAQQQHKDITNERDNERYVEWRNTILHRDQNTCILCGTKEWIQVHHIIRWIDNNDLRYSLSNGVALCIPCHTKYHGPQMQPFPYGITSKLETYISTLYGGDNDI
jgi:predicted RNA-binding protein